MSMNKNCSFYVASCVTDGGVYLCELDGGNVKMEKKLSVPMPMWIEADSDGYHWVLMRAPFENNNFSGVAKYSLDSGERICDILSTEGEVACHLALDGKDLYAANYISGSVWSSRGKVVTHSGKGVNPVRQTCPHVHSTFFSTDKRYVICCDLGVDKIFVYDRELNAVSEATTPSGSGARHLVFSTDGKYAYVISEMGASIHTYAWSDGVLKHLSDVSLLPASMTEGKGSAIRLSKSGRFLYTTDRATKEIVVFEVDGAELKLIQRIDCRGDEPRDLLLIDGEKYAVCANQFSDSCSVYGVGEDGMLDYISSFDIPAPISIVEKH